MLKITSGELRMSLIGGVRKERKQRKDLEPHRIGRMRLSQMNIAAKDMDNKDIERLGTASVHRNRCIVGKVQGKWVVVIGDESLPSMFIAYFRVNGKKIKKAPKVDREKVETVMLKHTNKRCRRFLIRESGEKIFAICQGKAIRKHCKVSENRVVVTDRKTGAKVWGGMVKRDVCI